MSGAGRGRAGVSGAALRARFPPVSGQPAWGSRQTFLRVTARPGDSSGASPGTTFLWGRPRLGSLLFRGVRRGRQALLELPWSQKRRRELSAGAGPRARPSPVQSRPKTASRARRGRPLPAGATAEPSWCRWPCPAAATGSAEAHAEAAAFAKEGSAGPPLPCQNACCLRGDGGCGVRLPVCVETGDPRKEKESFP